MRLRNNPNAIIELKKCDFVVWFEQNIKLELKQLFKNDNPVHIEVGSGKGQFLIQQATQNSNINYIAIEKYPTVAAIFAKKFANYKKLDNLKILVADGFLIDQIFNKNSISKIYLNFSDPWPKKRHENRRLTNIAFINKYKNILKANSIVELKTDNDALYLYSLQHLIQHNIRIIYNTSDLYSDQKALNGNISTEYENKFKNLNKNINKIIFEL